jgi:hypothetical protein
MNKSNSTLGRTVPSVASTLFPIDRSLIILSLEGVNCACYLTHKGTDDKHGDGRSKRE